MSKNLTVGILLGIATILIGTYTYFNITLPPLGETGEPTVSASIFPVYDIARNVAGDEVAVTLLLPPGASPHTFEPTPTTLKELRDASVLYVIGHGADDWVTDLLINSNTKTVTVDSEIEMHTFGDAEHDEADEHENEAGHSHDGDDPHYWLSIPNAKHIATNIAEDLVIRFPESAEAIQNNLQNYLNELDTTDTQIRTTLENVDNTQIVTLHDAWYYFAEEYGLEVAATFEPTPGREPTAQYLAALGHAVSSAGVKAIYTEPQLSTDTLKSFVEDQQITIAILDPLGGIDERDSYISTMIYNAETISRNQ